MLLWALCSTIEHMKWSSPSVHRHITWIIAVVGVVLICLVATKLIMHEMRPRMMVVAGSAVYDAEIVNTEAARQKGLSGRSSIAVSEAMLFEFESDGLWSIWMKDMKFPIDIVWIDNAQRVVHIERNIKPDAVPHTQYAPPKPARFVLELASGQAQYANIRVGSVVQFDIERQGL